MTVDEIMELVHARDCTISYAERWDQGPAWKVSEVRKALLKADSDLRTAIESLAKDAERFNFLCDCENEQALDLLANHVGQREDLIELVDELIKEKS